MRGRRRTTQDYHALAKKRGWAWSDETIPKNTTIPTTWKCSEGHRFERSYNNATKQGKCPTCFVKSRRHSEKDYHALAREKGFEYLGPYPTGALVKTRWKCAYGHIWEARYNCIQQKRKCPYCSNHVPKNVVDYRQLAKDNKIEYLGPFPKTTQDKTRWRCGSGHIFNTRYSSIQQGHGCHFCNTGGSNLPGGSWYLERDYHTLAREKGLSFVGPFYNGLKAKEVVKWECMEGHQFEAAFSRLRMRKQSCPVCARKSEKDYHERAHKFEHWWLGPLPHTVLEDTRWRCVNGHEWETSLAKLAGCMECWILTFKSTEDYHTLAKERGCRWVGKDLPQNVGFKTSWECSAGHKWEATYTALQVRTGCPACWVESISGENSRHWRGGISFEPYGLEWTDKLREKVRKRDDYTCAISGEVWRIGQDKFHVHHINYDKTDNRPENLITLCSSCHAKTNSNRDLWQIQLGQAVQLRKMGSPIESIPVKIELDPWEKGPILISFDGGVIFTEAQQLDLW